MQTAVKDHGWPWALHEAPSSSLTLWHWQIWALWPSPIPLSLQAMGTQNAGWEHDIPVSHAKPLQTAPRRMPIYCWPCAMKDWPNEAIQSSWCWQFLWPGQLEVHLLAKYLCPKGYHIQVSCLDNSVMWRFGVFFWLPFQNHMQGLHLNPLRIEKSFI